MFLSRINYAVTTNKVGMNTVVKTMSWASFAVLILSSLTNGTLGQCIGPSDPPCSSCVNDTAVCSGRCIGNSSHSRSYSTMICTGWDSIHNVDLSLNFLNHLDCSTSSLRLKKLTISHNNISIDNCSYWETNCYEVLRKLEYIDLSFNRIRNTCNASAVPLLRLKYVNLSHNDITSVENLSFFTAANTISVLDLSYNNITYLPWDPFVRKPSLMFLNISHNNFHQLFACHNFAPKQPRSAMFDVCREKNNNSTFTASFFNDNSTGSCVESVSKVNVGSLMGIQCNITMYKSEKVLHNESTPNDMEDIDNEFRMEMCTFNVECYVISTSTTISTTSEIGDRNRSFPRMLSSTLIGVVIIVIFLLTIGLKFIHLIKKRHIARRDKAAVAGELYTDIGPQLTDFQYKKGHPYEDRKQRVCYSEIPGEETFSSLPLNSSIGKAVSGESSMYAYQRISGKGCHGLGLDTVEIFFSREVPTINEMRKLSWYQSTENIKESISYEDIDKNDNFKTIYAKIDKDNHSQESNDSEEPSLVENMECRLNLTKQSTSNLPIYYKSTENIEKSICYHTIASSGKDIDKNDNVNTIYAKIDEYNNNQGSEDSEEPSFVENIECLNLRKESTSNLLKNPFDHENSLQRNNIGSCHFKDEETNEEKGDLNQDMGIIEGTLDRNKSKSLDMVANPCYEPTTSPKVPVGSGQINTKYEIIDEDDLCYES